MLSVRASLDATLFRDLRFRLGPAGTVDQAGVLTEVVSSAPELADRAEDMLRAPATWFALDRMTDPHFWAHQDVLFDHLAGNVQTAASLIDRFVPPVPDDRRVDVAVVPVPGLLSCYGTDAGRQIFGLYDGASPAEAVLFLAHTYYHELTEVLDNGATVPEPSPAHALREHIMRLVRNEGVANYAVLADVVRLRDTGATMYYFDYAGLIGNDAACSRAMVAFRELTAKITDATAGRLVNRLEAGFKNPRLPVINLLGIQMARAIARCHGEATLIDVDGQPAEEFFRLYESTDDPLRESLFGVGGMAQATGSA